MKITSLPVYAWLPLSLALAGCALNPPQSAAPTATVKLVNTSGNIDDLLSYCGSLKRMSAADLGRELQVLNTRQGGGAMLAMEKALVLGSTHDSADLTRAQTQLNSVLTANDADAVALKPLAELLAANYAEMRRLAESADKANQLAKENQRRLDQLSDKLEALKNIERTLPGQPK